MATGTDVSDGTAEAKAAADWWTEQLHTHGNTGDGLNDAVMAWGKSQIEPPTPEQVKTFRTALEQRIMDMLHDDEDRWARAKVNPSFGSMFRSFGVDYGPDGPLYEALEDAGIATGLLSPLPTKTQMVVNPGEVRVSKGYAAEWETIYPR